MRLQGEDSEDFNIPALISLVLKCYEVARTIQVSDRQGEPNRETEGHLGPVVIKKTMSPYSN